MGTGAVKQVITHDERVEGWTSFHSFQPDMMVGMNNKFFSFINGNLYIHHQNNRNNYYGVQYKSKLSTMFNKDSSTVKEMLALNLEGNQPWDVLIKAYINSPANDISSSIADVEFVKNEGMWFAYTRRSEDQTRFDSKSTYGIGRVLTVFGNDITFNGSNSSLTVGDVIVKGSDLTMIGNITNINNQTISFASPPALAPDDFIVGMKDSRVEGASLRGYNFRVDMEIDSTEKVELFAVNAKVIKSFAK